MYKAVTVGLGNIAWKMGSDSVSGASLCHRDSYEKNDKTILVGGYSPFRSDVELFSNSTDIQGYDSLSSMLKEVKPDIVSICSPEKNHAEHLEECIARKVPMIWLEKPATTSTSDLLKLENLRSSMSPMSKVLVNYQRRYTSSYQQVKNLLVREVYGKCLSVNINYSLGLVKNGSHMMDILNYLFPLEKLSLLWVEKKVDIQSPSFVLSTSDNIIIQVSGIESTFHNIDISVTFEEARVSVLHGGMTSRVENVKENDLFPGYYRLYDENPCTLKNSGFDFSFDKALSNLIDSFESDSEPLSNLATALHSQRLVEAVLNQSIDA